MRPSKRPLESQASGQSLTYTKRLHYRWEYRRFFDRSSVFRLSECTVFRIKNDVGHFRLGITIKARGSSIERNRVKRQIRESFRTQADILGDHDYNVVIPASKKMAFPFHRKLGSCIRNELKNALKKVQTG